MQERGHGVVVLAVLVLGFELTKSGVTDWLTGPHDFHHVEPGSNRIIGETYMCILMSRCG
jgi:hypothetical protein